MMYTKRTGVAAVTGFLVLLAACADGGNDSDNQVDAAAMSTDTKSATSDSTPTVRPSAPISFTYEIQSTPVVGQPVAINVMVTSSVRDRPISLSYRVVDASSMTFPKSQALKTQFAISPDNEQKAQQVTVIPQREGRLYVNVSAEVETPNGTMAKTIAIPIQVGSAPPELEINGELVETEDGEVVISMPSQ